ncbi:MAG: hypothetical protein QOG15_1663 [Solirubrobacteraceae bacterium]|jgi:DNA-binding SARP family transcriptional activator|nr:hypothetical protein [Solirubrobacteraceae bacterium]
MMGAVTELRTPEDLSADERQTLRRAHERLRSASQELQALEATEPIKNRWEPEPVPAGMLDAARVTVHDAYADLARCHRELLGWEPGTE